MGKRKERDIRTLWRLYYCPKCCVYYPRLLRWNLAANHCPVIKTVVDDVRTFAYTTQRCTGPARVVRDPAVLAAYRLGGENAVHELLGPDAAWG